MPLDQSFLDEDNKLLSCQHAQENWNWDRKVLEVIVSPQEQHRGNRVLNSFQQLKYWTPPPKSFLWFRKKSTITPKIPHITEMNCSKKIYWMRVHQGLQNNWDHRHKKVKLSCNYHDAWRRAVKAAQNVTF